MTIGHHLRQAFIASALLAGGTSIAAAQQDWTVYENERFGYEISYPADVFQPELSDDLEADDGAARNEEDYAPDAPANNSGAATADSDNQGGKTFVSLDGRAKIVLYGAYNTENFSPLEYRETILKEFEGYDEMTYGPKGRTWFVLSGYRGGDIYYQKVMFSCGGKVINALSITFPNNEKPLYEPIIERMEDSFRTSSPPGCRR